MIWPFAKLSFFLLYIQLFRPILWLRYACYIGALFTILFYTSIVIATLVFTAPSPGETFQAVYAEPRYLRSVGLSYPTAGISLILDVFILILPIAGVSSLQLSASRKFGVMLVFMTGLA